MSNPTPRASPNLDGSWTEFWDAEADEVSLLALLRETFEEHWRDVSFGPCIEGAVFEGRFSAPPRLSVLDGYATVQLAGSEAWHFHLCIGPHAGTPTRPTPPALAAWRRCARAAFFRNLDPAGRASSWGYRLWNGRGEQMLSVFFPNPWLDPEGRRYVDTPDWSRLHLWNEMRARYAGEAAEPPPVDAQRPVTH